MVQNYRLGVEKYDLKELHGSRWTIDSWFMGVVNCIWVVYHVFHFSISFYPGYWKITGITKSKMNSVGWEWYGPEDFGLNK